jgi:hypothetical protein
MATVLRDDGVMVTTLPDGLVVESYPDGTTLAKREDGLQVLTRVDGTTLITQADGIVIETRCVVFVCLCVRAQSFFNARVAEATGSTTQRW